MSEDLTTRIAALERRVSALEATPVASTPSRGHAPTPREFLLSKGPKSQNDKTLAAGYYLEMIQGKATFNLDHLEAFYEAAKEARPKNRRDAAFQNVKRGYFREVGDRVQASTAKNEWSLSNTGIKRVEDGFPKEA